MLTRLFVGCECASSVEAVSVAFDLMRDILIVLVLECKYELNSIISRL